MELDARASSRKRHAGDNLGRGVDVGEHSPDACAGWMGMLAGNIELG